MVLRALINLKRFCGKKIWRQQNRQNTTLHNTTTTKHNLTQHHTRTGTRHSLCVSNFSLSVEAAEIKRKSF